MARAAGAGEGPDARAERILAARARALAPAPATPREPATPLLAFDAGPERYALPLAAVLRVERVEAVARVPEAGPGHVGLVNLRGRPCLLLDVPAWLGLPGAAPSARRWALVLGARGPELAVAADRVEIAEAPSSRLDARAGPRLGATADARVVLDPAALLGEGAAP